jgi:large subunit ribosomal protein L23
MALFDFLKRKEEIEKAKQPEKKARAVEVKKEKKTSATKSVVKKEAVVKTHSSVSSKKEKFSYSVVKTPHISEKASYLAEDNKYVFQVSPSANKPEIKKSIEGIYHVNVLSVNIIKIPGKKRRLGRTEGMKKGHTKAIVTLKEGQKIEVI